MILPHISAASLHAGQCVAAFFSITCTDMVTIAALATRTVDLLVRTSPEDGATRYEATALDTGESRSAASERTCSNTRPSCPSSSFSTPTYAAPVEPSPRNSGGGSQGECTSSGQRLM